MASLDELNGSSPLQELISQVIQTVAPKKEYRSSPDLGGVSMGRYDSQIEAVNSKLGRAPTINANDFFLNGPSASTSDSAWSAIYSQQSASVDSVTMLSGRSPSEMADALGFNVNADWPRYQNMTMDQMMIDLEAKYPRSATTTTTTTRTTTTTTTTKSTSGNSTADALMGDTKAGQGDGATVDERAALANKAAEEIKTKAETPEGMAAWKKLAKRMKNNPKKTSLLASGVAALAVVSTLVGLALNRYLASDGAEISFTSIKTHPEGLLGFLVDPTDVDCQWKGRKTGPKALPTVPLSDIRVLETDAVIFHEAQLPKVEAHSDGVNPTKVTDPKKEFSVSTETGDSSDIDYKNKGWGVIHTSFSAHFAAVVAETVDDIASSLNKMRKQFFPDFSSILNGILVVIALIVGVMAIGAIVSGIYSLSKSNSSTSNTG
jgi:hypothetical protein